jgi:Cu+-exporting ATPase
MNTQHGTHTHGLIAARIHRHQMNATTTAAAAARAPAGSAATVSTCPMHPKIGQDRSRNNPMCSMTLALMLLRLDVQASPELIDFQRRFCWPFFRRGAKSVVERRLNLWTLISLATAVAFVSSLVATPMLQVLPAAFVSMGPVALYFEAAVVIISLTLLGQFAELNAQSQASATTKSLPGLAPQTARRRSNRCGPASPSR